MVTRKKKIRTTKTGGKGAKNKPLVRVKPGDSQSVNETDKVDPGKSSPTSLIATTMRSHRPSHIVVFRKPSENNVKLVTSLGMPPLHGQQTIRAGVSFLRPSKSGSEPSRLYSALGVMTGDLSVDQAKELQQSADVDMVVRNEVRTIPPIVTDTEEVAQPSTLIAYLQGMRDATDAALRFASGQSGSESVSAYSTTSGEFNDYPFDVIRMSRGYDRFTGKNITVAVLDTGIDLVHPDFLGRVAEDVNAVSFVPGESVQDGNGHGTHCAGTIAGPIQSVGGRRYGVAPDVELLIGKVLNNLGSGSDDEIIDGIDWAANSGAQIISMSLGSTRAAGAPAAVLYERIAKNLLDSGTLIIAAAGNDSARPNWIAPVNNPAAAQSIMGVAAIDRNRRIARFSCGQVDDIGEVSISGPGVQIYSSWTGGGFRSISGTSMATPHVAGVAALVLEQNPDMAAAQLWQKLTATSSPAGQKSDFGAGIVQAP